MTKLSIRIAIVVFALTSSSWAADKTPEKTADAGSSKGQAIAILSSARLDIQPTAGIGVDPLGTVIRSQAELVKLVGQDLASGMAKQLKVPSIDFKSQMLIHVFGGKRSTGGATVDIMGITLDEGAKTVTVHWKLQPPTGVATQADTFPGRIVLIEKTDAAIKFDPAAGGMGSGSAK